MPKNTKVNGERNLEEEVPKYFIKLAKEFKLKLDKSWLKEDNSGKALILL